MESLYDPGEQVKVFYPLRKKRKSEKLLSKWEGPYYIVKKLSEVNYEVKKGIKPNSRTEVVHVSKILSYCEPLLPYPQINDEKS